jgi:hypothetical protein
MSSPGLEPVIRAMKKLRTYILGSTASRKGLSSIRIRNITLCHYHSVTRKTNEQEQKEVPIDVETIRQ